MRNIYVSEKKKPQRSEKRMPITASEYAAWANAAYTKERCEAFLEEPHTLDEIKDVESPLQEFEEYGGVTAKKKK